MCAVSQPKPCLHRLADAHVCKAFTRVQVVYIYSVDAARALNLEHELGTLEPGKVANFTILEENPLTVDAMRIRDIGVKGVVYRGALHVNSL